MSTLWSWALLMVAVLVFTALLALLTVRLRRDWRMLRGEGVTVEAEVTAFAQGHDGRRFPVYAFTTREGARHIATGNPNRLFRPRLGQTQRLVYLPGAERDAEISGLRGPLALDALVLGLTLLSGWVVLRMMGG